MTSKRDRSLRTSSGTSSGLKSSTNVFERLSNPTASNRQVPNSTASNRQVPFKQSPIKPSLNTSSSNRNSSNVQSPNISSSKGQTLNISTSKRQSPNKSSRNLISSPNNASNKSNVSRTSSKDGIERQSWRRNSIPGKSVDNLKRKSEKHFPDSNELSDKSLLENVPETFNKDQLDLEDSSIPDSGIEMCSLSGSRESSFSGTDPLISDSLCSDSNPGNLDSISGNLSSNRTFSSQNLSSRNNQSSTDDDGRNRPKENRENLANLNKIGRLKNVRLTIDDEDKDVCEVDSEDEEEFYKIKVKTRLVSYENSTLVIKNTAKSNDGVCNTTPPLSTCDVSTPSTSTYDVSTPLLSTNDVINSIETTDDSKFTIERDVSQSEDVIYNRSILAEPPLRNDCDTESTTVPVSANDLPVMSIRGKLGHLMSKGRSLLGDVRYSSYLPDVKKFHDVTKKSLFSIVGPLASKGSTTPAVPEHEISIQNLNNNVKKQEHTEVPEQEHSEVPEEESSSFNHYFSPCYCQGLAGSSLPQEVATCSCSNDGELPTDIKEILDADYARMWWTITGNFGNILPIDWSKSYTRQKFLPVLNLNEAKKLGDLCSVTPSPRTDDDLAHDLDLHQLIVSQAETEPVKSADEVIKEIDDIMQEGSSSEDEGAEGSSKDGFPKLSKLPPALYHDKLKDLSVNELNDSLMELEMVIRQYSETLINQLALRDELEYEKELKNTFISLLLQVQGKRRNVSSDRKKVPPNGLDSKYLTTVIPYHVGQGSPSNHTLQILIKILKAINEDSPTVPTLLTDYILKVLCPS